MHRVGMVNGVFDLFHPGHARFLWEAKKRCSYLIAAVNDDASVRRLKGETRPFDILNYRIDRVAHYADQTLGFNGDVAELLRVIRPDVVIRGWDQALDAGSIPVIQLERHGDVSTTRIENERQAGSGLDGRSGGAPLPRGAGPCPPHSPQGETK